MFNLSFALAVVWLAFAVGLLVWHAWTGDPRLRLPVGGSDLSLGWAALVLALYNLVRWWSTWSYQKQRREMEEGQQRREKERQPARRESEPIPDPNFRFTDLPPGRSQGEQPR